MVILLAYSATMTFVKSGHISWLFIFGSVRYTYALTEQLHVYNQ